MAKIINKRELDNTEKYIKKCNLEDVKKSKDNLHKISIKILNIDDRIQAYLDL